MWKYSHKSNAVDEDNARALKIFVKQRSHRNQTSMVEGYMVSPYILYTSE